MIIDQKNLSDEYEIKSVHNSFAMIPRGNQDGMGTARREEFHGLIYFVPDATNTKERVIKLWIKGERFSRREVDSILAMMTSAICSAQPKASQPTKDYWSQGKLVWKLRKEDH